MVKQEFGNEIYLDLYNYVVVIDCIMYIDI